jgi:hypothetical protein
LADGGSSESGELDELELELVDGGLSESDKLDELELELELDVEKADVLKLGRLGAAASSGSNLARSRRNT